MYPIQICKFNPNRDIEEVVSGLAVDVTEMLETGIVHDSGEDLEHNSIDDPNNIIGLVRDEFAAIDAMRAVKKYGKKPEVVQAVAEGAASVQASEPSNS